MHDLVRILDELGQDPRCLVAPASGLPDLAPGHVLPKDLAEFYRLCGGVDLFPEADFGFRILAPHEVIGANLAILGVHFEDDRSSDWYVLARSQGGDHISIDLAAARNGWCYDSSHELHGVAGSQPVVATSFLGLLVGLVRSQGSGLFWLARDFDGFGDAYG